MATADITLELRINNPYSNGEVFVFNEGDAVLDGRVITYVKSIKDRYFTVAQGDSLSSISFEAYGDSKYYWVIAQANGIDEAYEVTIGQSLLIPDIEKIKTTNI